MFYDESTKGLRRLVQLLFVALIAPAAPLSATTLDEFGIDSSVAYDATRHVETPHARLSFKEYRMPEKTLLEMSMEGMQISVLVREDQGKAYSIMPSLGMYQETTPGEVGRQSARDTQYMRPKLVGEEVVNGHPSKKYSADFTDPNGYGSGFVWVTHHGVPIRFDMTYESQNAKGQRVFMELKDLNVRSQDPSRFELPANLRAMGGAFSMPGLQTPGEEAGILDELGDVVVEETQEATKQEAREKVRDGLKSLFGK